MTADLTAKLERIEGKLAELSNDQLDLKALLEMGYNTLFDLETQYKNGDMVSKRELIGSIYPEKMMFDGFSFRTARLNEAVELIYSLGAGFSGQKKDKKEKILFCPVR